MMLITGPNMSGKSTYMRQVALIVILAKIGSPVPARSATVGKITSVFTRLGSSDDLFGGRSTFMVEMTETAKILTGSLTKNSETIKILTGPVKSFTETVNIFTGSTKILTEPVKILTIPTRGRGVSASWTGRSNSVIKKQNLRCLPLQM